MPLQLLEERYRRLIELMQEGVAAIERQDGAALNRVSAASLDLLAQIERGWCLALGVADGRTDHADLADLRTLMSEVLTRSVLTQQRIPRVKVDTEVRGKYWSSLQIPPPTSHSTTA